MARIVVTTFGSIGDLNPFVALGLALRSSGHDVLFAVEANFQQQVSLLGLPVRVLTGDQAEALDPYSHQIFNSDQPLTSQIAARSLYPSDPPCQSSRTARDLPASGSAHLGRVPVCCFYRGRDAPDSLDLGDSDTLNTPLSFNRGAAHARAITRTSATLEQSLLLVSRRDLSPPGCGQTGEPTSARISCPAPFQSHVDRQPFSAGHGSGCLLCACASTG